MIAPIPDGPPDFDISNGHFFRQANGFSGASELGFAVTDDDAGQFWTEFLRYGGVDRLGYPVTNRFVYRGFLTQVFQKMALQWRPDMDQAVPLNTLDELSPAGNAWSDEYRQTPRPPAVADEGQDQDWDATIADHLALLDAVPALRDYYSADPDPLETFGLPVAVQSYGDVVTLRLQRAVLQLWTDDTAWASAGTVVRGNAGDLAKDVGVWPSDASTPGLPPAPPGR
jgi:hypothetical protein